MSYKCGVCRNLRLLFKLGREHLSNFIQEYSNYKNVCDISQSEEMSHTFKRKLYANKAIQDIRQKALKNYDKSNYPLIMASDVPIEELISGLKTYYLDDRDFSNYSRDEVLKVIKGHINNI